MRHIESISKRRAFPENHADFVEFQTFSNPFVALKPNEFHLSRIVNECGDQSFLVFAKFNGFYVDDFADDLDFGNVVLQFVDLVITRPVNIPIGKKIEQMTVFVNSQFLAQQSPAVGTDAFEVFDGGFQEVLLHSLDTDDADLIRKDTDKNGFLI